MYAGKGDNQPVFKNLKSLLLALAKNPAIFQPRPFFLINSLSLAMSFCSSMGLEM
jgi:hypothetical protein